MLHRPRQRLRGKALQASESINGISFVTECGAWGIIFAVSLAAILVFNFIKQLEQFKKAYKYHRGGTYDNFTFSRHRPLLPGASGGKHGGGQRLIGTRAPVLDRPFVLDWNCRRSYP